MLNNSMTLKIKQMNIWQWTTVLYVFCIFFAIIERWANYISLITIGGIILAVFLQKGRIYKRTLSFIWVIWILAYPILDYCIRGESTVEIFRVANYLVVAFFLLFADEKYENTISVAIKGAKIIAWFECIGVFMESLFNRLYVMIAWRLLGGWTVGYSGMGFSPDPTVACFILTIGFAIYFSEMIFAKTRKNKIKNIIILMILFVAIVATGKRSFLIATAVAVILEYLFFASGKSLNNLIKAIFIIIILVGLVSGLAFFFYYLGSDNGLGRLGASIIGIFNGEDVSSMRSTWIEFMDEWRQDNVIFGIGWESFKNRIYSTGYADKVPNGHNVYAQILCEEGYIGFIVFVLIGIYSLSIAVKNLFYYQKVKLNKELELSYGAFFIIIIFYIYCYFGNAVYDSFIYMFFYIAILMVAILQNKRKQIKKNEGSFYGRKRKLYA